jgi:hypothetical protein
MPIRAVPEAHFAVRTICLFSHSPASQGNPTIILSSSKCIRVIPRAHRPTRHNHSFTARLNRAIRHNLSRSLMVSLCELAPWTAGEIVSKIQNLHAAAHRFESTSYPAMMFVSTLPAVLKTLAHTSRSHSEAKTRLWAERCSAGFET